MTKLPKNSMKDWALNHLRDIQGGVCPLCCLEIDTTDPKAMVVDHCHETGEIRGVLHRSCNRGEGAIAKAAGMWIVKKVSQAEIEKVLNRLLEYYASPGTGYIYHAHKTPEEKAVLTKKRRARKAKSNRERAKLARKEKEESNAGT